MRVALGCVLLLLAGITAHAAPGLEPPAPALGERARLLLDSAPEDSTEWPQGVGALLRSTADPRSWEVIPVRVGQVGVAFPAQGDTLWWEVEGRLEQAAPELLRPLWSVGDLGPNWWPTGLIVLAALLPLVVLLLRRLLRRRTVPAHFGLPEEPPHIVALRRLDQVEAMGWPREGRFERFYVEASHALRAYIGGRYRVPALDWTSSEVVRRLEQAGYPREGIESVDPLLRSADAVKFAGHRPSEHQADDWLARAREWIHATAVAPVYSTPEAIAAARAWNAGRSS